MPLLFGVLLAAAMVVGWFTVTLKAPAARANLFADLPVEVKPPTSAEDMIAKLGELKVAKAH